MDPAGQTPTRKAMPMAMGTNRVVFGSIRRGGVAADWGCEEQEMVDVEEEATTREASDVMMSETEIATTIMTGTGEETEVGAPATI